MTGAPVIILLHGVGSRGADLAPLGTGLQALLPRAKIIAPDASEPFDQGGSGRQWFSVRGITEANRPARVEAARTAFDATLRSILHAQGAEVDLSRVALVGFSQGAIMALDAAASGRWSVRAVVAMAGRLATPAPLVPAQGTKVLLLHGEGDAVMPIHLARQAQDGLGAAGAQAELQTFPGLGHGISQESLEAAGRFLAEALLAPSTPTVMPSG